MPVDVIRVTLHERLCTNTCLDVSTATKLKSISFIFNHLAIPSCNNLCAGRADIAKLHGITPDMVVAGSGSDDILGGRSQAYFFSLYSVPTQTR